jgi:hypothetical protein
MLSGYDPLREGSGELLAKLIELDETRREKFRVGGLP